MDAGHIYGDNLERQLQLRLHKDGKLKYQVKNQNCEYTCAQMLIKTNNVNIYCVIFINQIGTCAISIAH